MILRYRLAGGVNMQSSSAGSAKYRCTVTVTILAIGVAALVPSRLAAREERNAHRKVDADALETSSTRVTDEQRDQAIALLRGRGSVRRISGRLFITLNGATVDDDDMEAVRDIALRAPMSLSLRETRVTSKGLERLRNTQLRDLALVGRDVDDETIRGLDGFSHLHALRIVGTKTTDAGIATLSSCAGLKNLRLTGDHLTENGLLHLRELKELRHLELGESFGDVAITNVNLLPHLTSLALTSRVSNAFLNDLKQLPRLQELSLEGANVNDETTAILLESAPELERLYLRRSNITDVGVRSLSGLIKLKVLFFDGTRRIGDEGVQHLASLGKLEALDLSESVITDRSIAMISKLPHLRSVSLMGTSVTTEGLNPLARLKNLRHLDLQATQVTSIPNWLKNQPRLLILVDE